MANVAQLVERVKQLQTLSNQLWAAAIEEDGRDWQESADECDEAYDDAIAAIESGALDKARTALETAHLREVDGGDAQHASAALRTLDEFEAPDTDSDEDAAADQSGQID